MSKKSNLGVGVEYKIGIISSLSATVIWCVLVGLWSLIAANIYSLFRTNIILTWQYIVAGISIGVTIPASVQIYKNKLNKFKPSFPSLSMDYMYRIIETELYFNTREEIIWTSSCNILALNELKGMKRTVGWSGSSIIELPIIESSSKHKAELIKNEPGKTVFVRFEVPLQKNQETDCKLIYILGDSSRIMLPFLSHLIKNPTEKMILRLCVPRGMVNSVKKCIYADNSSHIALSSPQIINPRHIGNNDVYEWEVNNPSLLYYYKLYWEFV